MNSINRNKTTHHGDRLSLDDENRVVDSNKEIPRGEQTILPVKHIVQSQRVSEGAGVIVHRAFPIQQIDYLDPFLLLDEMGPTDFKPGTAKGFPDHPHKGFETVTYVLEGGMRHRDSEGNEGLLGPGDVQWMTAGRGIVHSEMPDPQFVQKGGLMHGFQLWVNLPRKDKLVPPRYQDLPAANVPTAVSEDGLVAVKIIAGQALGVVAPIETHTDMMYLHFSLKPGAGFVQPVPANFTVLAYVVKGEAQFDEQAQFEEQGQFGEQAQFEEKDQFRDKGLAGDRGQFGDQDLSGDRGRSRDHALFGDNARLNDKTLRATKKATAGQLVIFGQARSNSSNLYHSSDWQDSSHSEVAETSAVAFVAAGSTGLELLLIGGEPIAEPVARYGPFVMNTREEILEAVEQYQNGLLGHISNQST